MSRHDIWSAKAALQEAKADDLHYRARSASNRLASVILRFRALWAEEAARLLRHR